MNDLATLTAQPRTLDVGGRAYQVHPLTLDDLGALQKWVNDQLPDPLALVRGQLDGFSPEQQKFLLKEAIDAARRGKPRLGTPEADALTGSLEGLRELLFLAIRRGDPAFTREAAAGLCGQLTMTDLAAVFGTAYGVAPGGDGPKAPAAGAPAPAAGGPSSTSS
jgi:hypothetical protein